MWFTGPKSKACYYYDHKITHTWVYAADLKEARAYGSGVTLNDGTFMIIGGAGESKILDSVEIVKMNPLGVWSAQLHAEKLKQPIVGHCSEKLPGT